MNSCRLQLFIESFVSMRGGEASTSTIRVSTRTLATVFHGNDSYTSIDTRQTYNDGTLQRSQRYRHTNISRGACESKARVRRCTKDVTLADSACYSWSRSGTRTKVPQLHEEAHTVRTPSDSSVYTRAQSRGATGNVDGEGKGRVIERCPNNQAEVEEGEFKLALIPLRRHVSACQGFISGLRHKNWSSDEHVYLALAIMRSGSTHKSSRLRFFVSWDLKRDKNDCNWLINKEEGGWRVVADL